MAQREPYSRDRRYHFLMVCSPIQSHVNPAFRLARRLTSLGIRVTFSTSKYGHRQMFPSADKDYSLPLPDVDDSLLCYHPYSDGFDDGLPTPAPPAEEYMERVYQCGPETLRAVANTAGQQHPVTCLIYTLFLAWAGPLARNLCIPSILFWLQPASLFVVYYHYFHDYRAAIDDLQYTPTHGVADEDSRCRLPLAVDLPGLPRLELRDLPSFLVTPPACSRSQRSVEENSRNSNDATITDPDWNQIILREFGRSFQILDEELALTGTRPKVLVNTFDAMEKDAIATLDAVVHFLPVGMMFPQDCTDPKASTAATTDLIKHDNREDYLGWLSRWPIRSVVYIAFGSYSVMQKTMVLELLKALVAMGRPFLWVLRKDTLLKPDEAALGEKGKLVSWCDQVEVLRHGSVGCFVTHCGWNSTSEAIAAGVPMVALPQWTDQPLNARLVEDVWRCGVRAACDGEKVVQAEELQRCVELVMGDNDQGATIQRAAAEWGEMARAAVNEGGSSDRNLRAFIDGFA